MKPNHNAIDVEALERESDLAAACARARSATICAQAYDGSEDAIVVWGSLIAMEKNPSIDNRLNLCAAFNIWAGQSAGPRTVAEMHMLQGQVIPTDDNPRILIDHIDRHVPFRYTDIRGEEQ